MPGEPQARHHRERGARHQHGLRGVDERERGLHARLGHGFPEEHHVGLQDAAAHPAGGNREVVGVGDVGVPVRTEFGGTGGDGAGDARVGVLEADLQSGAGGQVAAGQADHPVDQPVQIDHLPAARALVQRVHVLGDDRCTELSQCPMPGVGLGDAEAPKPHHRAKPVTAARLGASDEVAVGDRVGRSGVRTAVVGDAGVRRDAGAGQRHPAASGENVSQCGDVGGARIGDRHARRLPARSRPNPPAPAED